MSPRCQRLHAAALHLDCTSLGAPAGSQARRCWLGLSKAVLRPHWAQEIIADSRAFRAPGPRGRRAVRRGSPGLHLSSRKVPARVGGGAGSRGREAPTLGAGECLPRAEDGQRVEPPLLGGRSSSPRNHRVVDPRDGTVTAHQAPFDNDEAFEAQRGWCQASLVRLPPSFRLLQSANKRKALSPLHALSCRSCRRPKSSIRSLQRAMLETRRPNYAIPI